MNIIDNIQGLPLLCANVAKRSEILGASPYPKEMSARFFVLQ
jgi:hypothetical protein